MMFMVDHHHHHHHHHNPIKWSKEENKMFETGLAIYDKETPPDRWLKVAAMIPGKTVSDIINHYTQLELDVSQIEAGTFPIPIHPSFSFLDFFYTTSISNSTTSLPQTKKGLPWTHHEHKQFLRGLLKYGKGDWRNISRNFVNSKTPTQVASHAQKYFMRQISCGKHIKKRRPSIHDITTLNLTHHHHYNHTSNAAGLLGLRPTYLDRLVSFPSGFAS